VKATPYSRVSDVVDRWPLRHIRSILAGQHQGVVAETEPDARRGEISPLNLLGVEPVAISIVTYQHGASASGHHQLPVLEVLIPELGGMLLGEGNLINQPVGPRLIGDASDALSVDHVTGLV
jgi:hypothetical protein